MRIASLLMLLLTFSACRPAEPAKAAGGSYNWTEVVRAAPYPGGYNFPVFVQNGRAFAVLPEGIWSTENGADWRREPLSSTGLNSGYLKYVQHDGAVYALGTMTGNYLGYRVDPVIMRTTDFKNWERVGTATTLPPYIFYGVISFKGALWMIGGADVSGPKAEVWRSEDALAWTRVVEQAPWSARSGGQLVVFHDGLWLIGGGVTDGPLANDVWSSPDGVTWARETAEISPDQPTGYRAVVFDDHLWLVGANRSGRFGSEMLVSRDGAAWAAQTAPWSPRGAPAVWTMDRALFLTGGKYSRPGPGGESVFVYSHDVWRMKGR